jgi:hypothetical protein
MSDIIGAITEYDGEILSIPVKEEDPKQSNIV